MAREDEARWQAARDASGLGPARARLTFDAFVRARQPDAYRAARTFAAHPDRWLLLTGGVGTGKTHLLCACARAHLRDGRRVVYWPVADLLQHLKEGYDAGDFPQRFAPVRDAEVLFLDDLGAERMTEWAAEQVFRLLAHRLDWDRPTALTTNLRPADSTALPPRLISRLADPRRVLTVVLQPGDYRTGGPPSPRPSSWSGPTAP